MLDLKMIRQNQALVEAGLATRGKKYSLDEVIRLDEKKREYLFKVEQLKNKRNVVSEEIGRLKKAGQPAENMVLEMREISQQIKGMDEEIDELEHTLKEILLTLPNLPDESVPLGLDADDNVELRRLGEPRDFSFTPRPHWEIGEELDIIDFERATKVAGARFSLYKGLGARLERSIINFMLDLHIENGYQEIFPPFLVNRDSMTGTGQLPKFAEEAFKVDGTDYYLIPTAEVPLTNLYRGEILEQARLPINLVGYSACFRAEAGAAGRDTRGLIRQHQFNKVELVKFASQEDSFAELEKLTRDAENVLKLLKLPYRVMVLCTGDMSFSAAKTYDIEVWLPSAGTYREISSCSNCKDFQARRANIRYKSSQGKNEYVHTLNGSALAVGRTLSAILENYQQPDGSVEVPEVLRPYMGVEKIQKC